MSYLSTQLPLGEDDRPSNDSCSINYILNKLTCLLIGELLRPTAAGLMLLFHLHEPINSVRLGIIIDHIVMNRTKK
jgi:hypothetical protein